MSNFMNEKKIYCGDYLEVDIIEKVKEDRMPKGKRKKKKKVSAPKQKNLNDKNAKRYFIQLVNTNFGKGDLHLNATYAPDELPETVEDADKEARNFIRRIDYRMKKEGLGPLKYILVTECNTGKSGDKPVRVHHHIIINGGLDRDAVEALWSRRRKKGEKKGKEIGFINADRLQPNNYGLEALCRYLTKDPQGRKRWSSSHNLDKPDRRDNGHKYRRRWVEKAAKDYIEDREVWEKRYPEYWLTECKAVHNDFTGWSIYLKLRKKE